MSNATSVRNPSVHKVSLGGEAHWTHWSSARCINRCCGPQAETFLAQVQAETGARLPEFIKDEFDAFLECGILAHGFLRLRCGECGHEKLVAFSCKRRGFCPSCGARRMAQSAAHLVDCVIPRVPVRQWVLSFPMQLAHPVGHPSRTALTTVADH